MIQADSNSRQPFFTHSNGDKNSKKTTRLSTKISRQSTGSSNSSAPTSPEPFDSNQPTMDLKYITSRLIVLTTSRKEQSDTSRAAEHLDQKHFNSYTIYSLDQSSTDEPIYRRELFHNRVIDLPLFDEKQSPCLIFLLWFCQKITAYLLQSPSNVAVLHCTDDSSQLTFGACGLLAYHKLFPRVDQLLKYYRIQRCVQTSLTAPQKRYIQYLCDLSFGVIERPHFAEMSIKTITLSPVPLVNRNRNGCRPFVDIYNEEYKKIFTSFQEISKLKVYVASDKACVIPINISFAGDLTIHISHATIGSSRKTHENGIRICELKINSNFSTLNRPELNYSSSELDLNEKCLAPFSVKIDMSTSSKPTLTNQDSFFKRLDETLSQPLSLFQNPAELKEKLEQLDGGPIGTNSNGSCSSLKKTSLLTKSSSFENPFRPSTERPVRLTTQLSTGPSSPINDNKSASNLTNAPPLLDIEPEISNLESSTSSDTPEIYRSSSSHGSQSNLLDDDSHLAQNLPPVITPTRALSVNEKKSSTLPNMKTPSNQASSTPKSPYLSQSPPGSLTKKTPDGSTSCSTDHLKTIFSAFDKFPPRPQPPPSTIQPPKVDNQTSSIDKDLDSNTVQIKKWTTGKKGNIRALLCSLSSVTWPECEWTGCQMHELITNEQVKKAYRRALLVIHPDKLAGNPNLPLAQLICGEIQEAWAQFLRESNK